MRFVKFSFVLLILLALFVPALAQEDEKDDRGAGLTIGFSQIGSESAWRTSFTEAVIAEAAERGINLLFSDAQQSQENQIAAIRAWLAQGDVDAIILAPVIESGWDDVLQEAADMGVPVIIVDRNVNADESLYVTRVSSDFVHEGRLAAAWLAQETSGNCNIVELYGTVGSAAAEDRHKGFMDVINLFGNMKIIQSQTGNFVRTEGKQVMASILSSVDPSTICAVFAHNDDMAIGAIEAIKEAGLAPAKDILIVSVDAIPDIFDAMDAGETNATVELSPFMGGPAFDAVVAYLNGEQLPKWIPVGGGLYTSRADYDADR
ncbi:MAG: sugar ABC transporter substrate-binding protein [Phototrophicales bacterium]|nr:MAG: sugar ABC transporter substrate-binding protein [Phototrophicales bacterium]